MPFGPDFDIIQGMSSGTVPNSGALQTLVNEEKSRKALLVFNDSPNFVFLKFGPGAHSGDFNTKIAANSEWNMPKPIHTGSVSVRGSGASGTPATGSVRWLSLN